MKLLLLHADTFRARPFLKTSESGAPLAGDVAVNEALIVFIHTEPKDEQAPGKARTKAVKQIKWLARKCAVKRIVLHSFAHLAEEKSSAAFAAATLEHLAQRLESSDFTVDMTPFGYSCGWDISVRGEPIAKHFVAV